MARLAGDRRRAATAQHCEEPVGDPRVERQARRQLHEHAAKLAAQPADFIDELFQPLAGVFEAVLMREDLRRLDGESKSARHALRPPLVGLAPV